VCNFHNLVAILNVVEVLFCYQNIRVGKMA